MSYTWLITFGTYSGENFTKEAKHKCRSKINETVYKHFVVESCPQEGMKLEPFHSTHKINTSYIGRWDPVFCTHVCFTILFPLPQHISNPNYNLASLNFNAFSRNYHKKNFCHFNCMKWGILYHILLPTTVWILLWLSGHFDIYLRYPLKGRGNSYQKNELVHSIFK